MTPKSRNNAAAIELPGGGRLGVAEYGRPDGRPIFYFHGVPGSRLEASLADRIGNDLGIRIVSFDRPGMGLSTFRRERKIPDIALDVKHLADTLGIGKFSVLGASGGAPYALACGIRGRRFQRRRRVRLSEEIPHCHSFFPPDEGHFSLPIGWVREILSTLVMGT